jgi:hypothetical protein
VAVESVGFDGSRPASLSRPNTDWAEISVIIAGVAMITFIFWHFFAERGVVAASVAAGMQEIEFTVKGGCSRAAIVVNVTCYADPEYWRTALSEDGELSFG